MQGKWLMRYTASELCAYRLAVRLSLGSVSTVWQCTCRSAVFLSFGGMPIARQCACRADGAGAGDLRKARGLCGAGAGEEAATLKNFQ